MVFDTDTSKPIYYRDGKLWLDEARGSLDILSANIGTLTVGSSNIQKGSVMNWENIKAWLAAKPAIFYYGIALGFFLGAVIF